MAKKKPMTEPREQRLIDASNLICERLELLPPGYEYRLCVSRNEAYGELIGPDGEEIEVQQEWHQSSITAVINAANEHFEQDAT
jgi:hypothetical protein